MKPILLNRSEIDDARWDSFIAASRQNIVYALSWYLDVVCAKWQAMVWPSVDEFEIVMPLPIIKKYGIDVVQQPLFCQYLGLFSQTKISPEVSASFLRAVSLHFPYISSYSFHPLNQQLVNFDLLRNLKFKFHVNHTYWLPLQNSYNQILDNYTNDRKTNLKRAENSNWELSLSRDVNPLINLFRGNHESSISGGVSPNAYKILEQLFKELQARDLLELHYATKESSVHAGALFVRSENMAFYIFNSADKIGRKGNARTLILDHFFKRQSGRNVTFDFESPEVENIAGFYKSFGSEKISFLTISANNLPFPFRQIQNFRLRLLKTS